MDAGSDLDINDWHCMNLPHVLCNDDEEPRLFISAVDEDGTTANSSVAAIHRTEVAFIGRCMIVL